jgi:YggT family protein
LNAFIIQIVETAFTVLVWLIIGRCILSFIRHDPYHPIIKFIYEVTEPVMSPFRRLLPPAGGLDFSPKSKAAQASMPGRCF